MTRAAALLLVLFLAGCSTVPPTEAGPPPADPATARTLSGGEVVGYVDAGAGAQVWRAIPFAAPPVGDLRWRAPRPPAAWAAQRVSTSPAPWCPQVLSPLDGVDKARYGEVVGQEDCLYLDVYAPPMTAAEARDARLPVMMWIHGGSNTWGRAEQYDGSALAARFKVVVVVVQYRIGALGWLSHQALRDGGTLPDDASPNFGTLDTIRALEWIKQDIGAFGGDAGRVTIFGESAGGHNVAALLASPRARGLFHRAIIQSGSFRSEPQARAEGLEGDLPGSARLVAPRIVGAGRPVTGETLRAAPLAAVFAAYGSGADAVDPPRIIADGRVLPAGGIASVLDSPDGYNAVPVITGTNHDEMKLFNVLDPRLVKFVLGKFPRARDKAFYEAVSTYPSRMWRANAVDAPATRMTAGGHPPVWTYRFDWDEEGSLLISDLGELLGAGHSLEIPFVFGHFSLLGAFDPIAFTRANAPGRKALSDGMMSYWVNFAATGRPGRGVDGRLPEWTAWTNAAGAKSLMLLDSPKGGGLRMSADRESGARIVGDLMADPTIKTLAQRCQILVRVIRDNPELAAAASGRCPQ
ncbi:MAG: carboxylesterase family protein [Caulobacter sp.]|nr:carboxylesterase family protein [Caulobacter sp.]